VAHVEAQEIEHPSVARSRSVFYSVFLGTQPIKY